MNDTQHDQDASNEADGRLLSRGEAEDLIGRAAKIGQESAEKLTRSEVLAAAHEVGVSETSVHQAEQEREQAAIALAAKRRKRRRYAMGAAISAATLLAAQHVVQMTVQSGLASRTEAIQQRRADVRSALRRQEFVTASWEHYPVTTWHWEHDVAAERAARYDTAHGDAIMRMVDGVAPERQRARDAEIAGAENRVHIAVRRYDAAVANYRSYVGSLPWWFAPTVPLRTPYSNEVSQW